jgi:ribonuclease HIII
MGTVSLILTDHEIQSLRRFISENKLNKAPITNEYELLRVKDNKINIILYKSGKLVYNDSDASRTVLNTILEKEDGYDYILGSDETGKGEWYGPLVVVATALKPEDILKLRMLGVKDSKTIKTPQIVKLARKIMKIDFKHHSIVLNPYSYNNLYSTFHNEGKSLNDIMAWAHSRVIQDILAKIEFDRAKVVIDKFDLNKTEYRLKNIDQTKLKIIQKTGAESETPVAAASIIAKYLFETEVDKLDEKYGLNLRNSKPEDIKPEILPEVAKIHFKNVSKVLND